MQERLAALFEERKKMGEVFPNQPSSNSPTKNWRKVWHPSSAVTLILKKKKKNNTLLTSQRVRARSR